MTKFDPPKEQRFNLRCEHFITGCFWASKTGAPLAGRTPAESAFALRAVFVECLGVGLHQAHEEFGFKHAERTEIRAGMRETPRREGKSHVVKDRDVLIFKFNV